MKKKVAIISPTGMLGSMVYSELKGKYDLILVYRNEDKLKALNRVHKEVAKHRKIKFNLDEIYEDFINGFSNDQISPKMKKLVERVGRVSAVINCAGLTKPNSLKNPANTFFINGALPHILSRVYKEKLIQIATDCVFDGVKGAPYDEDSKMNPNDLYGLSKMLGEPSRESLVLRTSIIGPEVTGFYLLIEWFRKQKGKTIKGFTNHPWNGITTKQYAAICDKIISQRERFPQKGTFHVFSNTVTKHEMLLAFREKYNVDCKIIKDPKPKLDRSLKTRYGLNKRLKQPTFKQMLQEL